MISDPIVKVLPISDCVSVTWMLGARCNYECMYCPKEFHDKTSRPHDLELMKSAWLKLHSQTCGLSLPYKIGFTGGEVTANKNFLPLVRWMRDQFADIEQIIITTNGSASTNYYRKLAQFVEAISFSTHSEFMDEQIFFERVLAIDQIMTRPQKSVHVNIMDEYWNHDRIMLYRKWLTLHGISSSINKINYDVGTRKEIWFQGKSNLSDPGHIELDQDTQEKFYNCRVIRDSGQEELVYAAWLHNQEQNYWSGWQCHAGHKRFYVDKNLSVYGGECRNDFLGTLTGSFEPLTNSTVCRRTRCSACVDDLLTEKERFPHGN